MGSTSLVEPAFYQSAPGTSPSKGVQAAYQLAMLIDDRTSRALPSMRARGRGGAGEDSSDGPVQAGSTYILSSLFKFPFDVLTQPVYQPYSFFKNRRILR